MNLCFEKISGRLVCLLLALMTLVTFWKVSRCDFINFDDPLYVTQNPHIASGFTLNSLKWCVTADLFEDSSRADYWQPVTFLARALIISVFGLNPAMHHSVNLVLHVINTLLLFHVLYRMTGATLRCALIAALWAVHPQRVESVAWITEIKDLLSGFFWLLALWAYLRYVARPGWKRYLPVLLLFTLGLMSKPMVVTFPLILLVLDFWPLKRVVLQWKEWRRWQTLIVEKLPLFALSLASGILTLRAQNGAFYTNTHISLWDNIVLSYGTYLWKTFIPWPLYLPYPPLEGRLDWATLTVHVIVLGVITLLASAQHLHRPWLLAGWSWFLITLIPVIGLRDIATADRFTYLPSIGINLFLVSLLTDTWSPIPKPFRTSIIVLFLSLSVFLCFRQTLFWRNSITLFEHAVSIQPKNLISQTNLGHALNQEGHPDAALPHLKIALEIKPTDPDVHFNKGTSLLLLGKTNEASVCYLHAIKIAPHKTGPYYPLGNLFMADGDINSAAHCYIKTLQGLPDHVMARNNLAMILATKGEMDEAILQFQVVVKFQPTYAHAHYNLGLLLLRKKQPNEAILHLETAVRLSPEWDLPKKALSKARKEKA